MDELKSHDEFGDRFWNIKVCVIAIAAGLLWSCQLDARTLWCDEGISWQLTQYKPSKLLSSLGREVHPPLYFLLLKGWVHLVGDSEVCMRLLSVLAASATIIGIALMVRESIRVVEDHADASLPNRAGLFAATLYAASPFVFRFAREVRMYTLGACLVVFGSWALLVAMRTTEKQWRWWLLYAVLRAAGLYTHNWVWMTLGADFCFAGVVLLTSIRRNDARGFRQCLKFVVAAGVALILFSPWLPTLVHQWSQVRHDYWIKPKTWEELLGTPTRIVWLINMQIDKKLALVMCISLLLLAGVFLWHSRFPKRYLLISSFAPLALALMLGFVSGHSVHEDRYLFLSYPFLVGIFAATIAAIRLEDVRRVVFGMFLASLFLTTMLFWFSWEGQQYAGIRQIAERLKRENLDNTPVIATSEFSFLPARYYLRDIKLLNNEDLSWDMLGSVDAADLAEPKAMTGVNGCWIIELYGWDYVTPNAPQMDIEVVERCPDVLPAAGNGNYVVTSWQLYRLTPKAKAPGVYTPPPTESAAVASVH